MKKNKVIGLVLLGLAFVFMTSTIIGKAELTFIVNSLTVMTVIICGVVLIFGGEEQK